MLIPSRVNTAKSRLRAKVLWIVVIALSFFAGSVQACPDFSQGGTSLSYTSDDLYTSKSHKVTAGGGTDLAECSDLPGYGFVMESPDFTLSFSGNSSGRALEFRLDTECDSILLVNDANGKWHYDDDSNGSLDAKIRLNKAANGSYDVWVGTRYSGTCSATLIAETF